MLFIFESYAKDADEANDNKAYECPICLEELKNPSTLNDCGHSFCHGCIVEHCKRGRKCPVCREDITSKKIAVNRLLTECIARRSFHRNPGTYVLFKFIQLLVKIAHLCVIYIVASVLIHGGVNQLVEAIASRIECKFSIF